MHSFKSFIICVLSLTAMVSAIPLGKRAFDRPEVYLRNAKRQAAAAPASGLTDVDILQFALTLEHLESTFYQQGLAKFPESDFLALGFPPFGIDTIKEIASSEATHVSVLLSAIAGAGFQPVAPCEYDFKFTDARSMLATAQILEAVGVSAYLGAAPLINNTKILSVAGSIVTVEARHQSFLRLTSDIIPTPAAFDTALGPRSVFTLAAPFIKSCPPGSNLNINPFPTLELESTVNITAGVSLMLKDASQPAGAKFCAFTGAGTTKFESLEGGCCEVPQGLVGEVYLSVTSANTAFSDEVVLAGPTVLVIS